MAKGGQLSRLASLLASACLLAAVSCQRERISGSRGAVTSSIPARELAAFSFDAPVGTLPPRVQIEKIIRGFWFYYPHAPSPGKRYWLQTDVNTWVEQYPNGHETRFRIIGRLKVKGEKGTLLDKIKGNPSLTKVPDNGTFQVFIPDKGARVTEASFRNLIKGRWQDWLSMGQMRAIK